MKITIFLLLSIVPFISCKENEIDESKPLIKSISFAGIPTGDVKLDQKLRRITIKIPALLPKEGLVPTVDLTQNSTISQGLTPDGKLNLTAFCACGASRNTRRDQLIVSKKPVSNVATVYQVVLESPSDCYEPNGENSLAYSRVLTPHNGGQEFLFFDLSVKNLYNGVRVRAVNLRNVTTDKTYTSLFAEVQCINACDNDSPNQLRLPFDTKVFQLPTGVYEFSISTTCSPDPIVFSTRVTFSR